MTTRQPVTTRQPAATQHGPRHGPPAPAGATTAGGTLYGPMFTGRRLQPRDLYQVRFRRHRLGRGFHPAEVTAFLRMVAAELAERDQVEAALRRANATLRRENERIKQAMRQWQSRIHTTGTHPR